MSSRLRRTLDRIGRPFGDECRLSRLHPLYEAIDTVFYSPDDVTRTAPHVRDGIDLKRMMGIVVIALIPCIVMALYNTGYQAQLAIRRTSAFPSHRLI